MTTFISKTTPPFCHKWQRVRVSSRHLIGRASFSIVIIIRSIIVIIIIIILILRIKSHWRRWRRSLRSKATHDRLLSCYTADTNVHPIQLNKECIKVSIHALKLCHDVSEWHIASRRWGEEGADVDGANWDGAKWEGGVADPNYLDLNYTLLRLTVV